MAEPLHDEQEQRKYQILKTEALPLDMLELIVYCLGNRVLPYVDQATKSRAAPDNPEHVKSTKRIDRDYAL